MDHENFSSFKSCLRSVSPGECDDVGLEPFKQLLGLWKNVPHLTGYGWNMATQPFASPPPSLLNYRLSTNQYNEELKFSLVDNATQTDLIGQQNADIFSENNRFLAKLKYDQTITPLATANFPKSEKIGSPELATRQEQGFWLAMTDDLTDDLNIARLGTAPNDDYILALGISSVSNGASEIPSINGLPSGVNQDLDSSFLAPYKHFNDSLFQGLFNPVNPTHLLKAANKGVNIVKTTTLSVETATGDNFATPLIVKQANTVAMKSTFWIQELADTDIYGNSKLRLQYLQVVWLEFFSRRDGLPGQIRWPQISISTLEKEII
jgi:hypothetical protein